MEILISMVIGIGLMELYAWLDPLARWLVERAAKQLPEDRAADFKDQFMADLASVPNSILKIFYTFRDCTLGLKDIQQTMYRESFEEIANSIDDFHDQMEKVAKVLERSRALVARSESSGASLTSTMNEFLLRLQQLAQNPAAQNEIERCRALNPLAAEKLSDFHARMKHNHSVFAETATGVLKRFEGAFEAQSRIKVRLLDERPLEDADGELLDYLMARVGDVSEAFDALAECHDLYTEPATADVLATLKTTSEAFKSAARAVKAKAG